MIIESIEASIKQLVPHKWDDIHWKSAFFALCSRIAYLPGDQAGQHFKQLGLGENYRYIDNNGAQCHVVIQGSTMIIAFRGTEPKEFGDIKADLKAWKSRSQIGGKVHDGFFDEVNKVWDEIASLNIDKKTIYVTGHSLGGAMATICASRLSHRTPELYTYGSPRVGNRTWLKYYSMAITHHRFVNNNDFVTKVPPALLGFKHHGKLQYINYFGNVRFMSLWQRVKDQWRSRKRAWGKKQPFSGFVDHSIDLYGQKLLDLYTNGEKLY